MSDNSSSATSLSPTSCYNVSADEAKYYYSGVSTSPPRLIYRSDLLSRPWVKPELEGLDAHRVFKRLSGVHGHKIGEVWENIVGPKALNLLDNEGVAWTSIDLVRFITYGENEEGIKGPVVIWVGVHPTLGAGQGEQIYKSTGGILELLKDLDIDDVTVEFRESVVELY